MKKKVVKEQYDFMQNDPNAKDPARPMESGIGPVCGLPERMQEYALANGEMWRVSRVDLMSIEIGSPSPRPSPQGEGGNSGASLALELARVHERLQNHARAWMIARRLFGIGPVLPPANAEPDDLRTWARAELMESLGITRAQLQQELDGIRGLLMVDGSGVDGGPRRPSDHQLSTQKPSANLYAEDKLLAKYGFSESLFCMPERDAAVNRDEKERFSKLVEQRHSLLDHPVAGELARASLFNELDLWRCEAEKAKLAFGSDKHRQLIKLKQDIERIYQEQLKQLDELCPWAGLVKGAMGLRNTVSELTRAYQEYKSRGDTALADGIFTAAEIEIEMRRSVQAPDPQYRADLVVYFNAARANLWDAAWAPAFKPSVLKKVRHAYTKAALAFGDDAGEHVPNLESDDPVEGEYEELAVPDGGNGMVAKE